MTTVIKINDLDIMTGGYSTKVVSFPHSQRNQKTKQIVLEINIAGTSQDDALDKQKAILDELYKIKDNKKDCILEIKPETTNSTFFEILNYSLQPSRVVDKRFTILATTKKLSNILTILVDNYGYASQVALGSEGIPQATKTLPNYFDLSGIKGEIDAFAEIFMKLTSANDVHNIYYGIKSEKLIADITNFNPILEAESQTLTNMTLTADADCRGGNKAYSDATYPIADWATYIKFSLNKDNYKGRYLVLIRVENECTTADVMKARLKYGNLYNDEYPFGEDENNKWQLISLGEVKVPYSETEQTSVDYEIQLKGNATDRIGIDYIVLLPIDECFGIRKGELNPITQNDKYLVNTIKKIFSTYLQDVNDNNYYDRGNFFFLPKGDNRIVIVSDNNTDNKITDSVSFWLNYVSRYFYLKGSN